MKIEIESRNRIIAKHRIIKNSFDIHSFRISHYYIHNTVSTSALEIN